MGNSTYTPRGLETKVLSSYSISQGEKINYLRSTNYVLSQLPYTTLSDSKYKISSDVFDSKKRALDSYVNSLLSLGGLYNRILNKDILPSTSSNKNALNPINEYLRKQCRKCGRKHNAQGSLCEMCSLEYKREEILGTFSEAMQKYLGRNTNTINSRSMRKPFVIQTYYQNKKKGINQVGQPDFYAGKISHEMYS